MFSESAKFAIFTLFIFIFTIKKVNDRSIIKFHHCDTLFMLKFSYLLNLLMHS